MKNPSSNEVGTPLGEPKDSSSIFDSQFNSKPMAPSVSKREIDFACSECVYRNHEIFNLSPFRRGPTACKAATPKENDLVSGVQGRIQTKGRDLPRV